MAGCLGCAVGVGWWGWGACPLQGWNLWQAALAAVLTLSPLRTVLSSAVGAPSGAQTGPRSSSWPPWGGCTICLATTPTWPFPWPRRPTRWRPSRARRRPGCCWCQGQGWLGLGGPRPGWAWGWCGVVPCEYHFSNGRGQLAAGAVCGAPSPPPVLATQWCDLVARAVVRAGG